MSHILKFMNMYEADLCGHNFVQLTPVCIPVYSFVQSIAQKANPIWQISKGTLNKEWWRHDKWLTTDSIFVISMGLSAYNTLFQSNFDYRASFLYLGNVY